MVDECFIMVHCGWEFMGTDSRQRDEVFDSGLKSMRVSIELTKVINIKLRENRQYNALTLTKGLALESLYGGHLPLVINSVDKPNIRF